MPANYSEIQELLQQRADCQARISLMPYDGTPEVKEKGGNKYIYVRKRVAGRLTSTYAGVYCDELYQILLRNTREARELKKKIRLINKKLASLGYEDKDIPGRKSRNSQWTFLSAEGIKKVNDSFVLHSGVSCDIMIEHQGSIGL